MLCFELSRREGFYQGTRNFGQINIAVLYTYGNYTFTYVIFMKYIQHD